MSSYSAIRGRYGEKLASKWLNQRGYDFIHGPIRIGRVGWDGLFWKQGRVFFIEVRLRNVSIRRRFSLNDQSFFPSEKLRRLRRSTVFGHDLLRKHFQALQYDSIGFLTIAIWRSISTVRLRSHEMVDGSW